MKGSWLCCGSVIEWLGYEFFQVGPADEEDNDDPRRCSEALDLERAKLCGVSVRWNNGLDLSDGESARESSGRNCRAIDRANVNDC